MSRRSVYPRGAIAAVKVLEHLGCEVAFPEAQTCCGQPMWNSGFGDEARSLARRMIDVFDPYERVVTPSGSCAAMVRDYYGHMFDDDPELTRRAGALAERTFEFVEFLLNELEVDPATLGAKWPGRATYHYSCHLRGLGMTDEALRVMRGVEGLEVIELEKASQCCGFGGTFAMKYPQISGAMVRDKVSCIQDTGAEYVVSNDSGCTMNIAGACHRQGEDVRFITLAEVLAEGLGLMDRST